MVQHPPPGSLPERQTRQILSTVVERHGDQAHYESSFLQVIDQLIPDLSNEDKKVAKQLSLDFVVRDAELRPRFAVEYDGSMSSPGNHHLTDPLAIRRDKFKDRLCVRAGLPMLRITSDYVLHLGGGRWPVLRYVTEAFYRAEEFWSAQEQGYIPADEPFGDSLTWDERGRLICDSIDGPALQTIQEQWMAQRLPQPTPNVIVTRPQAGVQAHAWLPVTEDRYLTTRVRVRDFHFQGVTPGEVAQQIAVANIGEQVELWLSGGEAGRACRGRELTEFQAEFEGLPLIRAIGGHG